jgi:2-acylglycerol O-acyltransferase 2
VTVEAEPAEPEKMTAKRSTPEESLTSPGKLLLNAVLGLFFVAWWQVFGIYISLPLLYVAVLLYPFQYGKYDFSQRMEVRSVIIIYFTVLSVPVLLFWIVRRGGLWANLALAAYVAWYSIMDDAPKRGGRFLRPLRQRAFWKHFAAYFPMKLTREEQLDPEKNYVFGYHPHGIISLGALCNFGTEATGFAQLFPDIDLRLLTLTMNFRIPFFREYLLGMGINDVSRESCERNLSRGPGSSIMIVVGGARESIETTQGGHDSLILSNRKGFVKLAMRKGASLVPVYSFGENDVFGVFHRGWLASYRSRCRRSWDLLCHSSSVARLLLDCCTGCLG